MKKLWLLLIWLVSTSAVLVWCSTAPVPVPAPPAEAPVEADTKNPDQAEAPVPEQGQLAFLGYKDFSTAELAKATTSWKKTAIFFHSKTCSSCAKLEKDIITNADRIPGDVMLLKADWDDNQPLAKKYNVEKYHTLAYVWENQKNIKWLFTLDDVIAQFDAPAPLKIAPKAAAVEEAPAEPTAKVEPTVKLASYDTYSPELFDTAVKDGKRVVLNFRASRCPVCKKTSNEIIEKQATLPADVVVLEADYDTYTDLKKEYGVVRQTTFVTFDKNGKHKETVENVRSLDDLLNVL